MNPRDRLGVTFACAALLVASGAATSRGGASSAAPQFESLSVNVCATCDAAVAADVAPPPLGESSFRPTQFSVTPVLVAVRHSQRIICSRLGGAKGL